MNCAETGDFNWDLVLPDEVKNIKDEIIDSVQNLLEVIAI